MAKFVYNSKKITSTSHILLLLNYYHQSQTSYKRKNNSHIKSKLVDELSIKLEIFMIIYKKSFYYIKKLQKRYYNKHEKSRSYFSSKKVLLNSKNINTYQNYKLNTKFFGSFKVFHLIRKQLYKLEVLKK